MRELENNVKFKGYKKEVEFAMSEILYLPKDVESDNGEEDF